MALGKMELGKLSCNRVIQRVKEFEVSHESKVKF